MKIKLLQSTVGIYLICIPSLTLAYIGPGMGAGVGAVILGVALAFFMAIFAVLWFPIKSLINKLKKHPENLEEVDDPKTSSEDKVEQNEKHIG